MITRGLFSSATDMWETPQNFFDELDKEFHFSCDVCATRENAKCAKFYTPEQDGLKQTWGGGVFNAFCKNTVFRYPCGVNEIHPTQKPLALWYELLRDNTNEGQIVLDTCMGSWTTAVACHKLNRRWIGFELDAGYYEKGKKRYEQFASQLSIFD